MYCLSLTSVPPAILSNMTHTEFKLTYENVKVKCVLFFFFLFGNQFQWVVKTSFHVVEFDMKSVRGRQKKFRMHISRREGVVIKHQ